MRSYLVPPEIALHSGSSEGWARAQGEGVVLVPKPASCHELAKQATAFFDLDDTQKRACLSPSSSLGYRPLEVENLALHAGDGNAASADSNESFAAELRCADGKGVPKFDWPALPHFRQLWRSTHLELARLGDRLFELLGLDPVAAAPSPDAHLMRIARYHPSRTDGQFGAGPHTDFGWFTFISSDREGLEVWHGGRWRPVAVHADHLLVLPGDATALATSNLIAATTHRVGAVQSNREALIFFYNPDRNSIVAEPHVSFADWLGSPGIRQRLRPSRRT